MYSLQELLQKMVKGKASDLHLSVGSPPQFRLDGQLQCQGTEALSPEDTRRLAYNIMTEKQKKKFEQDSELDLSFGIEGLARFRCNIFMQRGNVSTAIRLIPFKIMGFRELGVPDAVAELAKLPRGLVLITGPTGSGKSSTLAALIDRINSEKHFHILTVEDPIEFLHPHRNCLINQREVHADTISFASALKYALRQDPDVVLIGEMRDLETIEAALNISETGHLVFGTLHTSSAAESINRIIDVFPSNRQQQVRTQLSFCLQGAVCQQLLPRIGGGRALALEVLICTPAIRAVIRDNKVHQIYSLIQAGAKYGMKTMNQSLAEWCKAGRIAVQEAMSRSSDLGELNDMLSRQPQAKSLLKTF
ncbi:MAG: type IV pilus twitching motility protein PilT [Candidatus Zixiibacteriota bacterium]